MKSYLLFVLLILSISSISYAQKVRFPKESLTGTYNGRHGSSIPDEVRILHLGNKQLWIEIDANGGEPNPNGMGGGLYSSMCCGVAQKKDSVAILIPTDTILSPNCRIILKFLSGHRLRVTSVTKDDCYHGAVSPDGLYKRVSQRNPKLYYFDQYKKPSSK